MTDAEPHSFAREACWRVLPSHANRSSTSGGRRAPVRPIQRSRGAVRKVIAMHRGTSGICGREISSEPGIDPRRATAEAQLLGLVAERGAHDEPRVRGPAGEAASEREPWVKVRWINISGISWDVIKAVSLCYAQREPFQGRLLLFIRILCHELGSEDDPIDPMTTPAFGSKLVSEDIESTPKVPLSRPLLRPVASTRAALADMQRKKRNEEDVTVEALKRDGRVPVRVSPFYIFLLRDGTVISISASPSGQALTAPIAARLRERDTLLRKSADPSLLVQSLLDLLVDKGLE
ncbi:hypothetical protein HDZ31DRAFT_77859, partial [Schizophyllum fasciatum]